MADWDRLRRALRAAVNEPLSQFLVGGAALFVLFAALGGGGEDPKTIRVDREGLLTFMQFRAATFDPQWSQAAFDRLTPAEREALIADYVRTEALAREAKALNLDANDFLAKQRLVQQVEFLTRGFTDAVAEVSPAEVAAHYEANAARYAEPARASFTHVFFDRGRRGADGAMSAARAELAQLNAGRVAFAEAPGRGDRFLYHVNYANRTQDEVESFFGPEAAAAIFALDADAQTWQGPIGSPHGAHLILLAAKTPARLPPLAEIESRVREEARAARQDEAFERAIAQVVSGYDVTIGRDVRSRR